MIRPYECTQCGGTDFVDAGRRRVRCTHCGSLFEVLTDEPKVSIQKGARVVFGKNANVEIRGDIEIEAGADVDIQGSVSVVKGKKRHNFQLRLIKAGEGE